MMTQRTQTEQVAILMLSLGEEGAGEVFKHLSNREVQEISSTMAALRNITREEVHQVVERLNEDAEQFTAVTLGSDEYVRAVLNRALGSERAAGVIEDILDTSRVDNGIDALNYLEATNIAELIADEHPQIMATILVHLDRPKASEVLGLLDERVRNDVMLRVANFGGVQPAALNELTDVMNELLSGQGAKRSKLGGVRTAAEILNNMNSSDEESIITTLKEQDPDLAAQILDEMFVFENLVNLDDAAITLINGQTQPEQWRVALKGASEALINKVLSNMSSRAAQMLREDMEASGPMRASKVEQEQRTILQLVRKLADDDKISLNNSSDDAYI